MVDIVEKSWAIQSRFEDWIVSRRRGKWSRVLRLAVRPEPDEYINTLKMTFAGLLLLGFTGFIMQLLVEWFTNQMGGLLRP